MMPYHLEEPRYLKFTSEENAAIGMWHYLKTKFAEAGVIDDTMGLGEIQGIIVSTVYPIYEFGMLNPHHELVRAFILQLGISYGSDTDFDIDKFNEKYCNDTNFKLAFLSEPDRTSQHYLTQPPVFRTSQLPFSVEFK